MSICAKSAFTLMYMVYHKHTHTFTHYAYNTSSTKNIKTAYQSKVAKVTELLAQ